MFFHIFICVKEKHKLLIGKVFGPITIKNIIPHYRHSSSQRHQVNYDAEVYCDVCKQNKTMGLRSILEGNNKSCGCLKHVKPFGLQNPKCLDLTGQKFHKLMVLNVDPSRRNRVFWWCRCDCGKEKSVAARHLRNGSVKSCGCDKHLTGKQNPCWKGYEEIGAHYWARQVRGAEQRNLSFKITIEYVWDLFIKQNKKCALTGQPLCFQSRTALTDGTASLDRIDSSRGYEVGNVWWVHKDINSLKSNFTLDNFREMCKLVTQYEINTR